MSNNYDNDPSVSLANELLGKVISYDGNNYMITVTEAYPYNDTNGYIQRQKKTVKLIVSVSSGHELKQFLSHG